MFYTCHKASDQNKDVWFLDSGCSNHMTGDESIFVKMNASSSPQVKMGNVALVQTKGKGTIAIETKMGTRFISNVLLVPDLEQNLLSVGQLMEHGYLVHFEDDFCKIFDKGGKSQVVAKIKMEKNRSFPLIFWYSKNAALKMDVIDNSWLWHRRFGHLNFQGLTLLAKKKMVKGLPHIVHPHHVTLPT